MAKPSKFVTKEAWGSTLGRQATPRTHPIGQTYGVTLHWEGPHMGSFPHSACDDKVRGIERYHEVNRGWADLAYNAVVCPHGYVFEGRGVNTQSAANGNSDDNDDWYAVCYLGGEGDPFTDAAKIAFIEAVQWLRSDGNAGSRVNGHRDHKSTECPGGTIYRWLQSANFTADPTPPPPPPKPPVTSHTRWAIRTTGVHDAPNGKKLRDIPPGYSFSVIDGSGHGNDGWIETTHHNWVLGADTTTRDPALPSRLSVATHNVWNQRDWEDDVLPTLNGILAKHPIGVVCLQECYRAPDLAGMVPGYAYRYQGVGYEPETPGYIEEHSNNVILVRDGVDVKAWEAYEMELPWRGPKLGVMHDPRIHRRVTVNTDDQNFRVINVHGPFGVEPKAETLAKIKAEIEALAELGDPVIAIGDWNVDFETLKKAMGPDITVDGGAPDMIAYVNCRKVDSESLGRQGSDTHNFKIFVLEA